MQKSMFGEGTDYVVGFSYPNEGGEGSPNPRLERAYGAIWNSALVSGPWGGPEEIGQPGRTLPVDEGQTAFLHRYGLLSLPGGAEVGCYTAMVPEGQNDWVGLYLPSGCLNQLLAEGQFIGEMHDKSNDGWRRTVDGAFVEVAAAVYRASPFELGSWGEEAGCVSATAEDLSSDHLASGGYLLSPRLAEQVGAPEMGTASESGFIVFPYEYG